MGAIIRRIAFSLIESRNWTGGYNYLLNLIRAIDSYASNRIDPLLFVGDDIPEEDVAPFHKLRTLEVVRTPVFNSRQRWNHMIQAMLFGVDNLAVKCFRDHQVDVVFESATFYGWRFPIPTIAWIPDFQHRHLPNLFGKKAYWKRELGFRAQIVSGRQIMLSSENAKNDCERFYSSTKGRTSVIRFAVCPDTMSMACDPGKVIKLYNLPEHFFYLPNQFWKHKNHNVVIKALNLLKQKGRYPVVVATGNPRDPRHPNHFVFLNSKIISYGLEDNFRILGIVPKEHVLALMRACIAMINPSLFEGWSTTVEEAKSLDVPMLLSDIDVHREQANDCASFFKPESFEQLAYLMRTQKQLPISSRLAREKMAIKASEERVRQFAFDFSSIVEKSMSRLSKV